MNFQYTQTIAAPTYDVFEALREDYIELVEEATMLCRKIRFNVSDPKQFRNIYKVFVRITG